MDHARLAELQGPDSIFSGLSVEDWAEIASRSVQICFVKGNNSQLQAFIGKRMLIRGREYWVKGVDYPVIVPEQIIPRIEPSQQ